jgi:outer membrane protein assembly factor BamB
LIARVVALGLAAAVVGCGGGDTELHDPTDAIGRGDIGLPVLSLRWRYALADNSGDATPQEFASPAGALGASPDADRLYVGSKAGRFVALDAGRGTVGWKRRIGAVSSRAAVDRGKIYLGTDDGALVCLSADDGRELWRYPTLGPVLETPVLAGDMVVFANEADQVYALDRDSGKFRWTYKSDTPEEFTLRGHAGVVVDGDLVFTGFASGTLVALRLATGSVAWLTSLKGEADRFVDVDTTPLVIGELVVAASSAGGIYGVDKATGLARFRSRIEGAGGLVSDGRVIYAAAADTGVMALDLAGNVIWRQGMRGGGDPSNPELAGGYLLVSLSDAGLYVLDKASGRVLQYFDPGNGISATPTVLRDRLFLQSNGGFLYGLSLHQFDGVAAH